MALIPKILLLATGGLLLFEVYIILTRGIPILWRKPPKHEVKYYLQLVRLLTLLAIAPFTGAWVAAFTNSWRSALILTFTLFVSIFAVGMHTLMKNYYGEQAMQYIEETYEMERPNSEPERHIQITQPVKKFGRARKNESVAEEEKKQAM